MKKVAALAFLLAMSPVALAQTQPSATAHLDQSVLGLPIYASDGAQIGIVMALGTYRGDTAMIGEVARTMGLGTRRVVIPNAMATVAGGRVVLSITSDRMDEHLEAAP